MSGAATPRRCPLWVWVLLALSVGLNLLGAGMLAGRHLRDMQSEELGRFNARLLALVPEAAQAEARAVLTADRDETLALQRRLTEASLDALDAFRAEPFDRAAFAAALDARDRVLAARRELRAARVTALAEALPAPARADFADRVRPMLESRRARLIRQLDAAE